MYYCVLLSNSKVHIIYTMYLSDGAEHLFLLCLLYYVYTLYLPILAESPISVELKYLGR